ncbi:putative WD repeat-containing protein [Wickerhamomyces ciferrii]|uniref:WD repeat-containing protein n=1 Tax=Wickerhamomyces ciferrii (strain ATCC 14091 / BCRC 22168 / CBS 111 / JCM 3599 / NBRC 0793 / NRRL Y-1031 F-60-10) TaxID=1206466 RepID=K0KGS3_WICCF|nr:putative WD repeat-containing protein [Wickerhamomyces ciferrii]CCH41382.1 putative WD repeat-containing protein [Wickerhamomyces ciferrii]
MSFQKTMSPQHQNSLNSIQTIPTKTNTESLNFINFNQDGSCISIGTDKGYKIFNCEPFGKCYSRLDGGIGIVEMLYCTSLIAIVGIGDQPSMTPRRLKIINTKRHSTICELTFPTTILSVKLNKSRLIVLLEEQIYIYDINNMKLLHTIETSPNPNGLIALSPTIDNNFLAYPSPPKINTIFSNTSTGVNGLNLSSNNNGNVINNELTGLNSNNLNGKNSNQSNRNGDVIIFNAQTLQPLVVVEAHKTTLAALSISHDGTLLATASDKGTIVRVFSIETGVKLYQFRRGTYPTKIYSLSFSQDNKFLTASSATETVHIFKLGSDDESNTNNNNQQQNTGEYAVSDELDPSSFENPKNIMKRVESSGSEASQSSSKNRRISNASYDSVNSNDITEDRIEPLIDISRRSVGRMIRKSSQNIGKKAAEKIGTFLPPKLTSMLEPSRHFASLKVPASSGIKNIVSVGKELQIPKSGLPSVFTDQSNLDDNIDNDEDNDQLKFSNNNVNTSNISETSQDDGYLKLIHVSVVSSEGYFYNYGLDPERGGDCILLNQYSLTDNQ